MCRKNMLFINVRWWVNLCIASMKKIDLNQLEYGKNQPIKRKKEIIKMLVIKICIIQRLLI